MNKLILRIIFFVLISASYYEFSDVFSSSQRLIELTGTLKLFVETKLNDLENENSNFKRIGENLRYLNDQAQKNTCLDPLAFLFIFGNMLVMKENNRKSCVKR